MEAVWQEGFAINVGMKRIEITFCHIKIGFPIGEKSYSV